MHAEICPVMKNDVSMGLKHACTMHACLTVHMMKYVLRRWAPSSNDHSVRVQDRLVYFSILVWRFFTQYSTRIITHIYSRIYY